MSLLSRTSGVYENIKHSHINLVKLENSNIQIFQKSISYLFSLLDRSDFIQNEISLRLWILRSTVLFTLLPFDDERLELLSQVETLQIATDGFSEMSSSIETIKATLLKLIETGINPKREWLLCSLNENVKSDDQLTGILSALTSGKSPGWSSEFINELKLLNESLYFIGSLRDLKHTLYKRIVLPCGCMNAPYRILSELIHSGRTSQFDVLLYSGESFNVPKRMIVPVSNELFTRFEKTSLEKVITEINEGSSIHIIDEWINNSFWHEIHGADRKAAVNLIPAHYVLFKNGTGTFLPKDGRVQILYENTNVSFSENDLKLIPVEDIHEGDLVILRVGQSGFLLDNTSESILQKSGTNNLYEEATQWKNCLDALLLTHSWNDIVIELGARGVIVPASTVQRWAGQEGLGPRNEKDFNGLIRLLVDKGKIDLENERIEQYITAKWNNLQKLRGVRHKAGHLIRQELFKALSKKLSETTGPMNDKTTVHMEAEGTAELIILRIFSVDQNPSYVSPMRIGRVDDLRSNKWLG